MNAMTVNPGSAVANANVTPRAECAAAATVHLQDLLEGLFAWLNANLPIDPKKPLTQLDVARITLLPAEFSQVPGESYSCAYRGIEFKRAYGLEFWLSRLSLPPLRSCADLRGRMVWALTGNTVALFH